MKRAIACTLAVGALAGGLALASPDRADALQLPDLTCVGYGIAFTQAHDSGNFDLAEYWWGEADAAGCNWGNW